MAARGNSVFAAAVSELFGNEKDSDCFLLFCIENDLDLDDNVEALSKKRKTCCPPAGPVIFGEPMPAHTFVLRYVSDLFHAQLEGLVGDKQQPAPVGPAGDSLPRPELRITLGREAEVSSARAAIQYAYTGQVMASSILEALEVRRLAAHLQIKGCTSACDERIEVLLLSSASSWRAASTAGSGSMGAYQVTPVLQLYDAMELWPDAEAEPSFGAVLPVAKRQLVAHFGDALAVLNTPLLRKQLLKLPAEGLEALLESDDFGTDTECSVMLLLATWMASNHGRTDLETRRRLCRHVRLVQLSRPYMLRVLPLLAHGFETQKERRASWFPIRLDEATFVAEFASASQFQQYLFRVNAAAAAAYDLSANWYNTLPRRQCLPAAGRTIEWSITEHVLKKVLENASTGTYKLVCGFQERMPYVVARGLMWRPYLKHTRGRYACRVFLECGLPPVVLPSELHVRGEVNFIGTRISLDAFLSVHNDQAQCVQTCFMGGCSIFAFGYAFGCGDIPLLLCESAATDDGPLSAWVGYLRDGKVSGSLTLLPPDGR